MFWHFQTSIHRSLCVLAHLCDGVSDATPFSTISVLCVPDCARSQSSVLLKGGRQGQTVAGSPFPVNAGRFWQSASSKEPYPITVAGQNFWHYRASAAPQGGRQRLPCLPTLLFAHPPWLGGVVRVGGATGMAGSEVDGTEHRGAGSASGTLGCASSAAATGADAPTLERAACRPAAITVSAREPAGDHAAHASRLARR